MGFLLLVILINTQFSREFGKRRQIGWDEQWVELGFNVVWDKFHPIFDFHKHYHPIFAVQFPLIVWNDSITRIDFEFIFENV